MEMNPEEFVRQYLGVDGRGSVKCKAKKRKWCCKACALMQPCDGECKQRKHDFKMTRLKYGLPPKKYC